LSDLLEDAELLNGEPAFWRKNDILLQVLKDKEREVRILSAVHKSYVLARGRGKQEIMSRSLITLLNATSI
jgi:hypothetical protein